jgi:dienelactone hydrolase
MTKVGATGHSQGGGATVTAASDSRISALLIWNASTSASKPFLAVSGDSDITGFTPTSGHSPDYEYGVKGLP